MEAMTITGTEYANDDEASAAYLKELVLLTLTMGTPRAPRLSSFPVATDCEVES